MLSTVNKYINLVPFSELRNWDVKFFLSDNSLKLSDKSTLKPFSYFTKAAKIDKVRIEDNKEYKILGVRSYGLGAYQNRISKGSDLKMKVYQQAKINHLFWCKVDTKNGAFGIIIEELANGLGSSNMTFAELDLSKININYLQILFRSKLMHSYMDSMVTGTTNRKYIKFSELLSKVEIPLPSLVEQNELVDAYNIQMAQASSQEADAEALSSQIQTYLLHKLGVKISKTEKKAGLDFINFKDISIWGVERLFNQSSNAILKSTVFPNDKLERLVQINPNTNIREIADDTNLSFIPMECISDIYGEWQEKRLGVKSNSGGYTKFQEGDLIWARITPCMQNGKSVVVKGLENGFGYGSTEFHVIRNLNDDINLEYIHILLRLPIILKNAMTFFTGSAGQQRVPKSFLEGLSIPLPPLDIQNEIVEHINRLKLQIKRLRTEAEAKRISALTTFEQQIFQ